MKKAWQKSVKFAGKAIDEFIRILDALIDFLKQGKDEMRKMIDDVFDAFKLYSKETRSSLNMQIPMLGKAEMVLYRKLIKAFYEGFKDLLLKYADVAKVMKMWNKLKPMAELSKKDIEMLLHLRTLNKKGFNKNAATMIAEVEVNGEVITLEYKALAGNRVNGLGLCQNADKEYIAKQLGMSVEETMEHYKTIDELEEATARFQDSEHKIFSAFDHDLAAFKAEKMGENVVKVKSMKFKTLYEPCNSCKRQIITRHEIYDNAELVVEAVRKNAKEYAKDNLDLKRLKIVKE